MSEMLPPLVLAVVVLVVYGATLAPSLYTEDSAEFVTAAATLGVPHPPGYPTYVLVGKIFSWVPIGDVPLRINIMSAIAGLTACLVLYFTLTRIAVPKVIAVLVSWTLAFSATYWSQSLVAEVYALHAAFVGVVIYLAVRWHQERSAASLLWLAFILGIGGGNHQLLWLLAPFVGLAVVVDWPLGIPWRGRVLKILGLFVLGACVYLVLPLLSRANPMLDWGNTESWQALWLHVSRAQYGDFGYSGNWGEHLSLVGSFWRNLPAELGWIVILFALFGLWAQRRNRFMLTLLISTVVSQSAAPIMLRQMGWGIGIEYSFRVYYLGAYIAIVLAAALGAAAVWNCAQERYSWWRSAKLIAVVAGSFVLTLTPVTQLLGNWSANDLHEHRLTESYGRVLLKSLPERAVLVTKHEGLAGDSELFTLVYLQAMEGLRPDVTVISDAGAIRAPKDFPRTSTDYTSRGFLEQRGELLRLAWGYAQAAGRPLATTFPVERHPELGLWSRASGVGYLVFDNEQAARTAVAETQAFVPVPKGIPSVRYGEQDFAAHVSYLQAGYALEHGNQSQTQTALTQAIAYDNELFSASYYDTIEHRRWWRAVE